MKVNVYNYVFFLGEKSNIKSKTTNIPYNWTAKTNKVL